IKLAVPTIPEFNYVVPLLFEQDETVAGVDSAEKDPLDSIPLPPEALSQLNDESSLNIDKQPAAAIDDLQEQVRDSIAVEIVKQLNTSNSDITDNFRALTFDLLRDPNTLFVQAVLILLGYLGVSTLVGVRILLGSRPEDLDLSEGRKVVCINGDTIRIGIEDPLAQLQLSQVNTIVYADEAFWDSTQFDANESRTILHTADETLFIDGTAAHYRRLVARVRSLLPDAVGEIDLNITWFRSYMGGFFWVCTTLITLLALWTELSSRVAFLPTDLLTTPILFGYSLSNLQRYLFLGFLLPPLHWFVIHPIRVRRHMPWHIRLADYRPYWFAAAGIVLALFAGVSNLSDFLNTTPDILRPIAAIGLAGAAAWALWHDRKQLLQGQKIVATGVTLACLLCVIWSGRYLTREVATSHFGIMGLRHQRLAQTADKTQQIAELTEALRNYDRAIEWGEVWLWAQKERLASAELYASRATANLQLALLDPDQASLFASHAAADYAAALKRIADPANPPTWVANAYFGQGYAYYINDQFEESLDAFLQANQLTPANPLTLDSIGTLYLNLGTAGQDSCSNFEQASNFLSQAAAIPTQPPAYQALSYRTNSTALFLLSQERSCNGDLVQAVIASPSAQASYCVTAALNPDNRREVALFEASADSAAAASEILPSDASLHNLAARLLYAAWSVCDASGAATRTRLVTEAVPAAEHASQLDPSSAAFRVWRDLIYDEATVGSIRRGDQRVGSGAYAEALDYYQLVAENTADVRAILRSGLAYAALGDSENALAAYQQGLAAAGDDERIITEAAQRLRQLERSLGVRFTQIEALFPASAIAPQLPVTPRRAFELSLAALDKGDQNEAERMFTHGLTLLQPTDWETLQSMLLLLDARRDKAVLHAVLRQQWPLLRELASDKNDIVGAHSVAF
ncbi:MAG TPA: hypothetical protein ENJ56_08405, partial [Anaerolineae bacterium]|nr:hypothetical protein [Anaerolineae bacterium]